MNYNSPSAMPVRKVTFSVVAGALVTILAWASANFAGVDIPAEIQQALTVIIMGAVAYLTPPAEADVIVRPEPEQQEDEE